MVSDDRGRGILSPSDREYASHPEQYSEEKSRTAVNKREEAIVERVRNAVLDFEYLSDTDFPDKLLESAFSPPEGDIEDLDGGFADLYRRGKLDTKLLDPDIEDNFVSMVAFLFHVLPPTLFSEVVEDGVKQAIREQYPDYEVVDASYNPDIRSPDRAHKQAKNLLENGISLSDEQVRLLLERGEVDPQKVAENVQNETKTVTEKIDTPAGKAADYLTPESQPESSGEADRPDPDREQ